VDSEKVVVAEIVRPRGLRGELVARSQSDVPGRLPRLEKAYAALADGSTVEVRMAGAWQHKDNWVLKFAGVESSEAAERFRGADLWVPYSERASLGEGEFFRSDLIGCSVMNAKSGECVGTVSGWQQHGGGVPLMEVRRAEGEGLVPFVSALAEVDLAARTIRMELPEGLLEL
jgi:16S rRNA processing protein RimM